MDKTIRRPKYRVCKTLAFVITTVAIIVCATVRIDHAVYAERVARVEWDIHLSPAQNKHDFCPSSVEGKAFVESIFVGTFEAYAPKNGPACDDIVKFGGTGDGSKYICTDSIQKGACVVYSIGSRKDFSFEKDIVDTLRCDVHTFDCTVGDARADEVPPGVTLHPWCVGGLDGMKPFSSDLVASSGVLAQYYTLRTIMGLLQHAHVDVLKVDTERHEYAFLKTLDCKNCLGQMAIEMRLHNASFDEWHDAWNALVHKNGMVPYSYELNDQCACCSEYSFLHYK